jgi:multiple sugar transport system ATP-binding protein
MVLSANPASTVSAYVDVTEMMGAETYLYLKIGEVPFTARVNQRSTAKTGETIKVAFDMNKLHLFDKETELAIFN